MTNQLIEEYNQYNFHIGFLKELKKSVAHHTYWDLDGWKDSKSKYNEKTWKYSMLKQVNKLSAKISRNSKGDANTILISPEASVLLKDLEQFIYYTGDLENTPTYYGQKLIGSLLGQYNVYLVPFFSASSLMVIKTPLDNPIYYNMCGLVTIDNIETFTVAQLLGY